MTKSFYDNNRQILAPKIVKCNKNRPTTCDDCEMIAACLYYYTGDDSEFEQEAWEISEQEEESEEE